MRSNLVAPLLLVALSCVFFASSCTRSEKKAKAFQKTYSVAIDTVPLPENPRDRVALVMRAISPVLEEIVADTMTVAIAKTKPNANQKPFQRAYSVAIDTVPLPESPQSRVDVMMRAARPALNAMVSDLMAMATGTSPTPETPRP